jgi:hypothetical protein
MVFVLVVAWLPACSPKVNSNSDSSIAGGTVGVADGEGTGADQASTVALPEWSMSSDCTSCHATEVTSGESADDLYGFHQVNNGTMACSDCHDQETELKTVHKDKTAESNAATRLKKTEIPSSQCTSSCHDASVLPVLSASSTVLTDSNGTTVNPHELPVSDSHTNIITCSDCHKMHKPISEIPENAQATCASCHHAGVYECGTCH